MIPRNPFFLLPLLLSACDPYTRHQGESFAGVVDPARFPAAYLGTGATASRPGAGRIDPVRAKVAGAGISYYTFPAPKPKGGDIAVPQAPLAYAFDPAPPRPFPERPGCSAPTGYLWDQRLEAFRLDEQGSIFTSLPSDASYLPVVAQVPVTSLGQPCQSYKSAAALLQADDVHAPRKDPPPELPSGKPSGIPDGSHLAWAIVNPAAQVYPLDPKTQLGPQRWGWYNRYLLAYLDGGYLQTMPAGGMASGRIFVAQKLYYPNVVGTKDAMGMVKLSPGGLGKGFDVLQAARGDVGYSPLCHVYSYTPAKPEEPATDARQIEMDPLAKPTEDAATPYIFCLQLR